MGLFKLAYLFNMGIEYGKARAKIKKDEKVLRELDEKEQYIKDAYKRMIENTHVKAHVSAKARVLGKDKIAQREYAEYGHVYYKYETTVEFLEDVVVGDTVVIKKGFTNYLENKYDYMNSCSGDIVDVHFHLRIAKDGKFVNEICAHGEPPMVTLENCRERFLREP